jgi:S-adenosylmethionine:tRNA ribosyltransferase-isomerase
MPKRRLSKNDFWYDLPKGLIAQAPIEPRDSSRLFVYGRASAKAEHRIFREVADYLKPGDLLVLNNTKVMPARLLGQKKLTQGKVEVFLLKKLAKARGGERWQVLLGGKVSAGLFIALSDRLEARVEQNNNDGTWEVMFNLAGKELLQEVEAIGHMPLPPYIRGGVEKPEDKERYQTVFGREGKKFSVAAPTAGLHFTDSLLRQLKKQGIRIGELTLHVGIGTFAPVKAERIEEHKMHAEVYEVSQQLIKQIIETKEKGGRVIAVGTTSARTLETVASSIFSSNLSGKDSLTGATDIFIYPGYEFKIVDALITNFHLPESTLLMLLAAFLEQGPAKDGLKIEKRLYAEAIKRNYRFFSYGDAMLIL